MEKLSKRYAVFCLAFAALLVLSVFSISAQAEMKGETKQNIAVFERNPVFSGASRIQWQQGEPFNPESALARVFVDDLEDGDLTAEKVITANHVNTEKAGTYKIEYTITDSDYNTVSASTEVEVGEFESPLYQRTLYSIGKNQALLDVNYWRGYYHDRQDLGIYMPAESSLRIRILNAHEFKDNLSLALYNNDEKTEKGFAIPKDGEWIEITHNTDSVPFILTPKTATVQPVVEYQFTGARELTFYRYGDQEEKFWDKWDSNQDTYAVIEGSAVTFLVPYTDRNKIINYEKVSRITDRFQSLDEMLDWYQEFVDQYDEFSGLDYHAADPTDQNIRSKFFIKANKHGAGQAYYNPDHSAFNGDTLQDGAQGYFCRYWLALHEFAHGYEGNIRDRELSLVETTNNIMAHYFQQTYLQPNDYGWLGKRANIENRAVKVRGETVSFNEITAGRKDFDVSLYMFVNVLDKIGSKKNMGVLHKNFRKYRQEKGTYQSSSDSIVENFSDTSQYNLIPYFETYHIHPSTLLKSRIYQEDYEIPYYLRNLVNTDEEAKEIKENLHLKGNYDLVTTADLAYTGYKSNITVQLNIDDLEQIKGRKLRLKDGSRIVKEVAIQTQTIALGEVPVGVYELELPNTLSGNYRYDYEFILAKKGEVTKEVTYEPVKTNLLTEQTQVRFAGLGDEIYASLDFLPSEEKMMLRVEQVQPHNYFIGQLYASLTVLDESGTELYTQEFIGDKTQTAQTVPIAMKEGYKIQIHYAEAGRLQFYNRFLGEIDKELTPAKDNVTTEYVMTKYGLMKSGWTPQQQEEKYVFRAEKALKRLKTDLTEEEQKNRNDNFTEKLLVKSAIEFLEEEKRQEIIDQNRQLFHGSLPEVKLLKQSLAVGSSLQLREILEISDTEDGDVFFAALLQHEIAQDTAGILTKEGVYPIRYDVTDMDGNRSQGIIRFIVSPYIERTQTRIPSAQLTAVAESQESGHGAHLAVDGSEQTYWQSNVSGNKDQWADLENHIRDSIIIYVGSDYSVGKLEYVPNVEKRNGLITKYKLYYSEQEEGDDFKPVPNGEGMFTGTYEKKTAEFDAVPARRLKLQAVETADGQISASEFYLYHIEEQTHTDCSCVIENFHITEQAFMIPFDQDCAEVMTQAVPSLGGGCKVTGHAEETIAFEYEIVKDQNRIGRIENGRVMANGTGTLVLRITAAVNGKQISKNVSVQVFKMYSERIPFEKVKGFAESEQASGADGPAGNALDGKENTYWHSNYSQANKKPNIPENLRNGFTIDLGDSVFIHRLDYVPRQDVANGRILSYQLYYSKTVDQDDFEEIPGGSGTWESNRSKKTALFEAVEARRIQIRALSTEGNSKGERDMHITAAEFYPCQLLIEEPKEYNQDCTCAISYFIFEDDTIAIPAQDYKRRVPLKALADLGAGCPVQGHGKDALIYRFTEIEDPNYIGFIEDGQTLVVSKSGRIKIKAEAEIPGTLAKVEKTAVFTVQKEQAAVPECTCTLTELVFDNQEVEIPLGETIKEIHLQAECAILSGCPVEGHPAASPSCNYEIVKDEDGIGIIAGDKLTVVSPGTIEIRVKAHLEGTQAEAEKTAVFTVKKEEAPKLECTCAVTNLVFENRQIKIALGETKKEISLQAKAAISGACPVQGHQTDRMAYRYEIAQDDKGIGRIAGNALTVVDSGTIQIKATAYIEGTAAKAEKTATFIVEKEKEPECSCTVNNLIFDNKDVKIVLGEDQKEMLLQASATISGSCPVQGHQNGKVLYRYEILDDPKGIGKISGDKLTLLATGTLQIKVTACIEGTELKAEKTAIFSVEKEPEKEPECSCMISGLKSQDQNVIIPLKEKKAEITLNASAQISGNCPVEGHGDKQIHYGYSILEDKAHVGSIRGNLLGITGEGTVTIKVLANIPGTLSLEKECIFAVYSSWEQVKQPEPLPPVKPGKVTGLGAVNKTDRITLSWKKRPEAAGYVIYRQDQGKSKWLVVTKTTSTKFTDKKLRHGTGYKYRVAAYIQTGNMQEEGVASELFVTATTPSKPSLKLRNLSGKTVKLVWNKNTGADKFEIFMKTGKGKFKRIVTKPGKTKSFEKSLKNSRTYQFKIRGYKKAGKKKLYSAYSKTVKANVKN